MVNPDYAGSGNTLLECLCDLNIHRSEFDRFVSHLVDHTPPYIAASALNNLLEKIKEGDASTINSIFRSWGIR